MVTPAPTIRVSRQVTVLSSVHPEVKMYTDGDTCLFNKNAAIQHHYWFASAQLSLSAALISVDVHIVVVLYNYGISYVTNFTGEAKNSLETSV